MLSLNVILTLTPSSSILGESPRGEVGALIIPPDFPLGGGGVYEPTVQHPEKSLQKVELTDVKMPPRGYLKSHKNREKVVRNAIRTLAPKNTMKRYRNRPAEPSKM